jgi:Sulfotransferase domain
MIIRSLSTESVKTRLSHQFLHVTPDMNHDAVFVLSTGRCGTQWLHDSLSKLYADQAEVTHEPIRTAYQPRRFFRADQHQLCNLSTIREVTNHVASIRETLKTKTYIETGWAHFAALPWLYEALEGRMRVVQLYRNPIATSFSLTTQKLYERDDWIKLSALNPQDPGVMQTHLQKRWRHMSDYEKCLFYWTEIHLYGQELQQAHPTWQWHALRFEDLFGSDIFALRRLLEFCGLPYRVQIAQLRKQTKDNYVRKTMPQDWRAIEQYAVTCELAESLGYDINETSSEKIASRYFMSRSKIMARQIRHFCKSLFRREPNHSSVRLP